MTDADTAPDPGDGRPRVGVSACLLGQRVRYDGGDKRDAFLVEELGPHVTWVQVCPELELGMGVPREPVRLVRDRGPLRMLGVTSGEDWTERMSSFALGRVAALPALDGYVLKSRSPSCGLEDVELHELVAGSDAAVRRDATGLFALALRARFPELPITDERRLGDPRARASFLDRLRAHHRQRRTAFT